MSSFSALAKTAPKSPRRITLETLKSWGNNPKFRSQWFGFVEDIPLRNQVARHAEWVFKRMFYRVVEDEPTLFVFVGEPGCGKTKLASRIVDLMAQEAVTVWHKGYWPKIPSVARYHWSELVEMKGSEAWIEATRADIVLIDDVGSDVDKFKTGEPTETLRLLLEKRQELWTLITTNILKPDWKKRWDSRVESRLSGGKLVSFAGVPDFRKRN